MAAASLCCSNVAPAVFATSWPHRSPTSAFYQHWTCLDFHVSPVLLCHRLPSVSIHCLLVVKHLLIYHTLPSSYAPSHGSSPIRSHCPSMQGTTRVGFATYISSMVPVVFPRHGVEDESP
ncbi:uncharacterized protein K460DRAFT_11417 [Cucurbitaria berberidis CBS 394.84]|uniref:Uncharacterized protein n=1 Tax=Cucurbitaria berberidis CBS 394.84 TaxID=1168544 RepID=A0A9P4LC07_9PLEO|nr:uncharacterized protein K460DRAFT_11417 [Cucurbitaria berberidis CBS 394.84]KAF1850176.1 hypothetical protein K460DRAFT_11417 [Cucurbitaria berberidis CBS 394.84]